MKKDKIYKVCIGITLVLLGITAIFLKSNYHIDELYSYNLANHHYEDRIHLNIPIQDDIEYESYRNVFLNYASVDSDNRFNYKDVYKNQSDDVHPPLYYLMFNFVCSLFPETFSKWYPGIINIIFSVLTFIFVIKIIEKLTNNKFIEYSILIIYVLTTGIIDNIAYFRMYIVATLWVTISTYLFLRQTEERKKWGFILPITIVTYLGALTHYYCIVYSVFISIVYGIYLLIKKEYKNTLIFSMAMLITGFASYFTFPAMVRHMFYEYRGVDTINNLFNINNYYDRLISFFNNISNEIFGNIWQYVILLMVFLIVLLFVVKKHKVNNLIRDKYIFIFIPSFAYFMLVVEMASYISERYISPIYPLLIVGTFCLIFSIYNKLFSSKLSKTFIVITSIILLASGLYHAEWSYLYRGDNELIEKSQECKNIDCICVHGDIEFDILYNSIELNNYGRFISIKEEDIWKIEKLAQSDQLIIKLLNVDNEEEQINQIRKYLMRYSHCDYLGSARNGSTYHLY